MFLDQVFKSYIVSMSLIYEKEEILRKIKDKIISKNIFISGSLDNLKDEAQAYEISKAICEKLIDSGYNIVTGFGKNIGYYVSGSSIQKLYRINESNIEKR